MSACACMGPVGDCQCIRRSKGLHVPITEAYVPQEWWDYLSDDEKETINELKLRAAMRIVFGRRGDLGESDSRPVVPHPLA